jgi:peroxiredoxin
MRHLTRTTTAIFSTCLLTAVLAATDVRAVPGKPSETGLKIGSKAPPFTCPLFPTKKRIDVVLREELAKGNVVLMSFFDENCKPCKVEIPRLTKMIQGFEGKPLSAYLVYIGDANEETVRKFLDDNGFTLPVIWDAEGYRVGERFKVVEGGMAHVPQIYAVSKNGIIKGAWRGFPETEDAKLEALLRELVVEEKLAPPVAENVTILFTNNTNGMLGPSPAIEVGGLARRATMLKQQRKASDTVILLDAGDIFPTSSDLARTEKVVTAYEMFGYDAVTIGEAEFVNGLKYLRSLTESRKLPFISSNVKICENEVCSDMAKSNLIANVGKKKVGIFAFMNKDTLGFTPSERLKDGKLYVKIVDYMPGLKGFMERYRSEVDVIIVLSHAGIEADRQLAIEVPGIDVIVGGHSQTFLPNPTKEGNTLIVQAASDGQYVGKLVLKFNDNGKPMLESYELLGLTKGVKEDPEVKAVISGPAEKAAPKKE